MTRTPHGAASEGAKVPGPTEDLERLAHDVQRLCRNMGYVIQGKPDVVRHVVICLLAEGHLLLEDVPGTGKTSLARALASSLSLTWHRIQFTPDLLPSDVTGVSVYNQHSREFEFKAGPVFANIVIADEINRASPKTQSALLEVMEEATLTADGIEHSMARPFMVVATQNPIDMEGTYVLPEAQRDRFMARISIGYPDATAEREMLRANDRRNPMDELEPVITTAEFAELAQAARSVFVSHAVETYILGIVGATRDHPEVRLGASPRASLQLTRAAKSAALLDGRDFVLPDDVEALAASVLAHRLVLRRQAADRRDTQIDQATALVSRMVAATPVPLQ
jgi:MoxR-like ATPase